jgi:acyl carrier protein
MSTNMIVKDYIRRELMNDAAGDLDESENLLASGVIDSLGILRLVSFVEEKFDVEVPDEDVTIENFQSVESIAAFVTRMQEDG